jgi:hypothetical protein
MRGVLLVLVACALSVLTHALETQMEQNNSATACARPREAFDVGLVLRNSTLYEQVYVWMHDDSRLITRPGVVVAMLAGQAVAGQAVAVEAVVVVVAVGSSRLCNRCSSR